MPQTFLNTADPMFFSILWAAVDIEIFHILRAVTLFLLEGLAILVSVALTKNVPRTSSGGDSGNHQLPHNSRFSASPIPHHRHFPENIHNDGEICCFQHISTTQPRILVTPLSKFLTHGGIILPQDLLFTFFYHRYKSVKRLYKSVFRKTKSHMILLRKFPQRYTNYYSTHVSILNDSALKRRHSNSWKQQVEWWLPGP